MALDADWIDEQARGFYRRYTQLMDSDVFPSELPKRPDLEDKVLTNVP